MSTIKGQNLRVLVNNKCIAMATSCTFHIATQTEDASTKDDTGDWAVTEITGLSWDASTDSLVTVTSDASGTIPSDLMSLMIAKTAVTLTFSTTDPTSTKNRDTTQSGINRAGQAYISDISITAANRQNSTISVQFTGTGALSTVE